ncbi:type I-E CRISPR-associated protein Cse1/CasA [Methylomonas koyamae]|uniref:Type I-E CRISPR-associated protein Cse1/CasA n=2 Tax=Methylomonas koyamae TaxID=702114 RepID=A0A291IGQ7_9GAMM|nr:type I-E CRISPR-associated protein Cse1/CasA [Methylomonas koyamae]ATG89555.1 type I-E CRISPR-associated protein Cse1/CasA [Methylomonas koyamae]OAI23437.1 type I-E CRISPR-associated protein Cse1/CasA [Methylomonas koyamae]
MNLLIDDWIPVEIAGIQQRISLQTLLCDDPDCSIKTFRDDMDLATLQLLVCLVQVVFMPDDKRSLKHRWQTPLTVSEYQDGIAGYLDWFDLLHPKTPFMQTASVMPEKGDKNWASLQKLFMGLPEKTSSSPTSSAFFDTPDEITVIPMGDAAIALFQQATNGFSLGGVGYSVGLKGSMPLTTLVVSESLRKSIWCNVLSREFLEPLGILDAPLQEPTWVTPPHSRFTEEQAHHIGLARGLFWQPAKVKLALCNGLVTGFYKEAGTCTVKGYWQHPHTPIDILRLQANDPKEKPYLSGQGNQPLWGQMLSYFYSAENIKTLDINRGGYSRALVVQQYQALWRGGGIKLAVGGYIKGGSTESLAGRKHELYSFSSGWDAKISEIDCLVKIGLNTQQKLDTAIRKFADLAETTFKDRRDNKPKQQTGKEGHFRKNLRNKAKQQYFDNSETIMHSILRNLVFDDLAEYQKRFSQLAEDVFEQVISPYEHEDKMLEPVLISRQYLGKKPNKLNKLSDGATP